MALGLDVCLSADAVRLCATDNVESGLTFQFTLHISSEGVSLARTRQGVPKEADLDDRRLIKKSSTLPCY